MSDNETFKDSYDVIVVGTGSAGMPAAIYSARFGLSTLIIGAEPGGLLTESHKVENYPGFTSIPGRELMKRFEEHVRSVGVPMKFDKVIGIEKTDQNGFRFLVKCADGSSFLAKSVILTTGSRHRHLGVPGEEEFKNKGVSYCATCDAPFYKGLRVAVVGGGDAAAQAAIQLSEHASKVFVLVRRDRMRADHINQTRLKNNPKIEILFETQIKEIRGDQFVTEVLLNRAVDGSDVLKVDGVFVEIGADPNSELAEALGVALNDRREIIIDENSATNVEGVFAAGDVANRRFKQALTGAAEGAIAAFSAFELLQKDND